MHYKENFHQIIKNLILADNLFIDKIFNETDREGGTPDYKSILKNSKIANLDFQIKNENDTQPQSLSYPLKGIEEFIMLLKATNIDKIKDYIVLYTLFDLGFTTDSPNLISLVNSLD